MTTPLTTFLPEVVPYAPNVPNPIAINAIRNALIEFCEQTAWDTYECLPQTGQAGMSDYEMDTPEGTEVSRVMSVFYDGRPLVAMSEETIRRMNPRSDWRDQTGSPSAFVTMDRHIVRLFPVPDTGLANALKCIVALRPERTAIVCTDDLWRLWGDGIAKGAIYRLLTIPQQSWTNLRAAEGFGKMFADCIGKGKIDRNRGLARGVLRAIPQVI